MMKLSLAAKRRIAWFFILTMVAQLATPYASFALTGGPSQPEVQSFEPIGTSEMVDVSSGSFTYNIPLMEVGGYPINLAYHSGVGMAFRITDLTGLLLMEKQAQIGGALQTVQTDDLSLGLYFIQALSGGRVSATGKFVKT